MATKMEDLPVKVQEELRAKRSQVPGWSAATMATAPQWMAFYENLSPMARHFIVDNLLEVAQQGSNCMQADHESGMRAAWDQLVEVVKLHNARVDEVRSLRAQIFVLQHPGEPVPAELAPPEDQVYDQELDEKRRLEVDLAGQQQAPGFQLYVVKDPPEEGHDGG